MASEDRAAASIIANNEKELNRLEKARAHWAKATSADALHWGDANRRLSQEKEHLTAQLQALKRDTQLMLQDQAERLKAICVERQAAFWALYTGLLLLSE